MLRLCCFLLLLLTATTATAEPMRAHAMRRDGEISVDGRLDEAAWQSAPKQGGFTQRFPQDGGKPSFDTQFAMLYDDKAIYVGVWASDPEPSKIRALLTRRDAVVPADTVAVEIDSYHDRRTAFVFQLDAAAVQRDVLLFDDENQDDTWDAVWTGEAAIDDHGWTAEYRIPLNQLRYPSGAKQEWGIQIVRVIGRTQETSAWSPWPRSSPQIVSKFGVVDGIDNLAPSRRFELLPYVLGGVDVHHVDPGNPLDDHVSARRNIGLDVRYGLGPAFTLSATINPDFGQVEADPSQVNLGANEIFFAEKRPFFLEGVDLFKLPIGSNGGSLDTAFYSRRIGAAPPGPNADYQYAKTPDATAIYGAAKLTGKTRDGWSIGVLEAVTGQESATIVDAAGARSELGVAPLTNYAVGRIKRDFNDAKTTVGLSATAVNRNVSGTPLDTTYRDQAYSGGFQIQHRWADNAWLLDLRGTGSYVHGSTEAIAATQLSNVHLFQRPDATDAHFDPTRRSLSGADLTLKLGKFGDTKHVRYGIGQHVRTPGLELNDVGFLQQADRSLGFVFAEYREDEPKHHLLNWNVNGDVFAISTFEPTVEAVGLELNAHVQFKNYWQLSTGGNIGDNRWDHQYLRGGPSWHQDPSMNAYAELDTDTRERVWFAFVGRAGTLPAQGEADVGFDIGATIQARPNIDIFVGPSFFYRNDPIQYVDQADDTTGQRHYVLARIHQSVASMTTRINWTFSPHLSLQAYAQPFIASGSYTDYKDIDNPQASTYADRFHLLSGSELQVMADGTVAADYNGSYTFAKPDFNLRQLRSTMVLRWEYRPGSTI
ncbi:MAG TPA: DUF5916 domain-containing protein, partial [Kofleriaceae bacterium]|nr:DUF5916 domain-containing protein [Kofleriaceae bacterium]